MRKGNALIALGLAAFAYWKYKMKPEDKEKVIDTVKTKAGELKQKLPQGVKDALGMNDDFEDVTPPMK